MGSTSRNGNGHPEAAKDRQSTAKSTTVGELVPQPHGGALRNGGPNRGGTGRPPDKLRKALQAVGRAGIAKVLKPIIDGKPVRVLAKQRDEAGNPVEVVVEVEPDQAVRVKAVDVALKYGLGTADRIDAHITPTAEIIHKKYIILPPLDGDDPPDQPSPADDNGISR